MENDEKLTVDHTFKPSINKTAENMPEKPFHERILENLRRKQENLIKLQAETSLDHPFQPQINRKSQDIVLKTQNNLELFSFKQAPKEKDMQEKWTFQPEINKNSKNIVQGDFFERLEEKTKEKEAKVMRIQQEIWEKDGNFKPKINRISENMKNSIDTVERLYTNVCIFNCFYNE